MTPSNAAALAALVLLALATLSGVASAAEAAHCTTTESCGIADAIAEAATTRIRADDDIDAKSGRPCSDAPAFVRAAGEDRRLVCVGIRKAVDALAACEIHPRTHVYAERVDVIVSPDGNQMFGRYDRVHDTVMVAGRASIAELVKGTPYATLPPSEFYQSIVVHETVHAIVEQNQLTPPSTRAAQEYPAYALQIAALPAASREVYLRQFDVADGNVADLFSDAILLLDPYYFAARAYTHFSKAGGSCAILERLIADKATFIAQQ